MNPKLTVVPAKNRWKSISRVLSELETTSDWETTRWLKNSAEFRQRYQLRPGNTAGLTFAAMACLAGRLIRRTAGQEDGRPDYEQMAAEERAQCVLIREILGNPFRPITPDSFWLTSTVTDIARGIYDSRYFSPMPILADALQDAGCENADILDHCRVPGPHVRGCWVVDLVLGEE